jgi:hypothetical protein
MNQENDVKLLAKQELNKAPKLRALSAGDIQDFPM